MSASAVNLTSAAVANGGDLWHPPFPPIVQLFGWFVAGLLSLETILGNSMVLLAYRLERSISKQLNNRFIVSLAISDLIIGIEGIPFFTVYVINGDRWPLGAVACEIWLFLDYTLCLVSILTVLLITADRYLSVCHTASYLKWQTPLKIQLLIAASWFLPALIFGIMIFGWPWIGGKEERIQATSNGECYAPFLANPYVNMGMYLAYYWTTLVAMLILYKGIHKAAKKLEKRSRAREHRHIALLLTQRLGTQVGVGLMLHAKRYHEETIAEQCKKQRQTMRCEAKDSGYITANTLSTTDSAEPRRSSFTALAKAVQTTQRLARFRRYGATFAFRNKCAATQTKDIEKKRAEQTAGEKGRHQGPRTNTNEEKCADRLTEKRRNNAVGIQKEMRKMGQKETGGEKANAREEEEVEENPGNCSLMDDDEDGEEEGENGGDKRRTKAQNGAKEDENAFDSMAIVSLSTGAFNDESLSSVLHFNPSAIGSPFAEPSASDTTSQIIANRRINAEDGHTNGEAQFKIRRNASSMNAKGRNDEKIAKMATASDNLKGAHRNRSKSSPNSTMLPTAEGKNGTTTKVETVKGGENAELTVKLRVPLFQPQLGSMDAFSAVMSTMDQKVIGPPSRRPSDDQRQENAGNGTEEGEGGGMLGRFFSRIHSWVRISMVGIGGLAADGSERTGAESSEETKPELLYGLPSFLHSSRSYSTMSSVSSQDGSRRPSFLHSHGQVPMLTITRGSIWDNAAAGEARQSTPVDGERAVEQCQNQRRSTHLAFVEENGTDGRKPSRILHSVFAPISAFHRRRKRTKAERRALKAFRTITFIVGLFAILWSPYYVVATVYGFCHGQCIPSALYNVSYYMCYLNSSLNPFAYALANRQFRIAFVRILRGNLRQL